MLSEQWVRDHLADVIEGDEIVLQVQGADRVAVDVVAFVELFAAVDVAGTADQLRERFLDADVVWRDADGNVVAADTPGATEEHRGYAVHVLDWHAAGLLA